MSGNEKFYCPLYKGDITKYDCDDISACVYSGYLFNDGFPFLLDQKTILDNKMDCITCERRGYDPMWNGDELIDDSRSEGQQLDIPPTKIRPVLQYALQKFVFTRSWSDDSNRINDPNNSLKVEIYGRGRSITITSTKRDMVFTQKAKIPSDIFDLLDAIEESSEINDWDKHIPVQPTEDNACSIELHRKNYAPFKIDTKYTMQGMPQGWLEIVKTINRYMDRHFDGIDAPKMEFEDGMVIYCSCSFDDGGKTYYYRTTDQSIEEGDYVVVPVGPDNCEKTVYVEEVEYFKVDEVPLPIEKTKEILRTADDDDDSF